MAKLREGASLILLGLMGILAIPAVALLAVLYVLWSLADGLSGKKKPFSEK